MESSAYDVIVVGAGMAGLTAAAYTARAGLKVLLCDKEKNTGGLVNSFEYKGFVFDGGIRAIENSGIVAPMLRQLGLQVDFLPSPVSIGIGEDVVWIESKASLTAYQALLEKHFPANKDDIAAIMREIVKIMGYMDVLYGIDNPLFMDLKRNPGYVFRTILPWMLKYALTAPKIASLREPVEEYLTRFSANQALIDMIAQHFFQKTPTHFALSYFSLYLDYRYPRGGTGTLPQALERFVLDHGGEIRRELLGRVVGASDLDHFRAEIAKVAKATGAGMNIGLIFGLVFLFVGLAFKISAVPFHMWTPDVYEGAPTPVAAFFAGAPKAAAMALFMRVAVGAFGGNAGRWQQVIIFLSIASMVLGAFAAIGQTNIKRLMAYSSIGHVGFALVGLSANNAEGTAGVLIYLAIYVAMTLGTFACILSMRRGDKNVEDISELAGLAKTDLRLAAILAILMFSLAGIPPLAGFFAKYYVFAAAIKAGLYWLAVIGMLASTVAAFY